MSSTLAGDQQDRAFERLYERYLPEVYRYVLSMVRNPTEAEDVTQTTFLNAYRALRAGATPRAPHNWLIAIAHNTYRSRMRRAMRRPQEVPLGDAALAVSEPERPNLGELFRALDRLPSNQRSALAMRELEGRTYVEIAEKLGVTVPAVEALVARARHTLRTRLGALRGLGLLLPRFGGGAPGAGVAAKAGALALVGIAGVATIGAGAPPAAKATKLVRPPAGAAPFAARRPLLPRAPSRRAARPGATARTPSPSPAAAPRRVPPAAPPGTASGAVAAPPQAVAAGRAQVASAAAPDAGQSSPPVAEAVVETVPATVAAVASALPDPPLPAVSAPPVQVPELRVAAPSAPAPSLPVTLPPTPLP